LEFKPQHHQAVNTACAISLMTVEQILYILYLNCSNFCC